MKTIILVFILIPSFSFSQFIKSNQSDSFTQQKRIVTKSVNMSFDVFANSSVDEISYYTINETINIVLYGEGKGSTILKDDIALLITDKDTVVIKSIGLQAPNRNYYEHRYFISKDDFIRLSKNKLVSVRRYTEQGIFNFPIKEKFQSNLMKLSDALLKEMDK